MKESEFAETLLDWYRRAARDLPWRRTQDPYCIWVSEVMLQQTRVAAVIGYYTRFLDAFPSVAALAEASEEALLSRWQGLGYYSRARNLHRAAREIVRRGSFPETAAELRTLPGIGAYTAGAIASAAFGERVPAVDGNVLRVMSRLTDNHAPPVQKEIEAEVSARFPASAEAARIFNQALMELGATVCVPNGPPKCGECPVSGHCLGRARGTAEALPVRAVKKARRIEERTVLVLCQKGKTALRKRPARGLLAGLWEFPNVAGALDEAEVAGLLSECNLTVSGWLRKLSAKHIFTHIEWHMTGYVLSVDGADSRGFAWADAEALREYAVPSAFARFREAAEVEISEAEET